MGALISAGNVQAQWNVSSDNHTTGNLGVGITSPLSRLHVAEGNGGEQIRISRGTGVVRFAQDLNKDNLYLVNSTGAKTLMFWKENGYVGIGTYQPQNSLHIIDGSPWIRLEKPHNQQEQGIAFMENAIPLFYFYTDNDQTNALKIQSGTEPYNLPRINIPYNNRNLYLAQSGGNVGINTDNPVGKLHIHTADWASSLLTFSDVHYTPAQIYHFQIESDGLKIKQDNSINYQFKSGGDFVVNNGAVRAKEVRVTINPGEGPDYVFESGYRLPSLAELETYITQNKHLPEVPSARQMEEEGLHVKAMNLLLLKKVEELTLYLIEQKQLADAQQHTIEKLTSRVNDLEKNK